MSGKDSKIAAESRWASASSFQDLCELCALFIEGQINYSPGYNAEAVDEETKSLVPFLTSFNRAGFLTTSSQPGLTELDYQQRAYVGGFARESVARAIARLSLVTDLHVVTTPPGWELGFHTPVTQSDFMACTWSGFTGFDEIEFFAEHCSHEAIVQLSQTWSVSVIDMQWGRGDHLWRELARAICVSEKPHPERDDGVDFLL